jgi:putative OPT family oligopeptide transporter
VVRFFRVSASGGVTGFDFLLSFALFAVGHLVGLWVGIAMFVGALIGWVWGVPHYSALAGGADSITHLALATWSHKVRFVGAGTIGVAAVWTLAKLVGPACARRSPHRARAPLATRRCCRSPNRTSPLAGWR